jgi:alpha-glucuronidase
MIVHTFREYKPEATYSNLWIMDGLVRLFECKILERPWRDNKKGDSCIPANGYFFTNKGGVEQISNMQVSGGARALAPQSYLLKWEYSPKFKEHLWELYQVPDRQECKFHTANYVYQLEGCLAPGQGIVDINADGVADVTSSRDTLDAFNRILDPSKEHRLIISHQDYPKWQQSA